MLSSAATVVARRCAAVARVPRSSLGDASALVAGERLAAALEHGELVVELDDAVAEAAGVGLEATHGLGKRGELAARLLRAAPRTGDRSRGRARPR